MTFVKVRAVKSEMTSGYTFRYTDYDVIINVSHIVRIVNGSNMRDEQMYEVYLSNASEPLFIPKSEAQEIMEIVGLTL